MICRNCNSEVGSAAFCPNCGARMNAKYCTGCGAVIPDGARSCPRCGKPVAGREEEPRPGKKELKTRRRKDETARTGFQSFVCLICGVAGLVLLGIITYNTLMGDMFRASVDGMFITVNPLTSTPAESFALVQNFEAFVTYFQNLAETISEAFGGDDIQSAIALTLALVPSVLLVFCLLLAALITCIAALVAVFRFIGGMCSKKFFTLVKPIAWALSAQLIIYLACIFGGVEEWMSAGSGTMINILLAAGGVAVCVLGNLLFAGRRFFRGCSIMKFVSNAGILAGALVALFNLPVAITSQWPAGTGSEALTGAIGQVAGEMQMLDLVFLGVIALLTIKCVFSLPRFVRKTASRLGTTFKFDGYEDVGFVGKSFWYMFGVLLLGIGSVVYVVQFAEAEAAQGLFAFAAGGVIAFVCAVVNRVFLNSDQR